MNEGISKTHSCVVPLDIYCAIKNAAMNFQMDVKLTTCLHALAAVWLSQAGTSEEKTSHWQILHGEKHLHSTGHNLHCFGQELFALLSICYNVESCK